MQNLGVMQGQYKTELMILIHNKVTLHKDYYNIFRKHLKSMLLKDMETSKMAMINYSLSLITKIGEHNSTLTAVGHQQVQENMKMVALLINTKSLKLVRKIDQKPLFL